LTSRYESIVENILLKCYVYISYLIFRDLFIYFYIRDFLSTKEREMRDSN